MDQLKDMLLGMSILLVAILIHLFIETILFSDFLGILGIIFILKGYYSKNK